MGNEKCFVDFEFELICWSCGCCGGAGASRGGVADEKFAEYNLLGKSYCAVRHGNMVIGKLGQMTGICIFLSLFAEARVSTYLTQNIVF